jgi:polyphosphate kinase
VAARYFESRAAAVLSPLGLDPSHPFPRILNKSLNFIVSLEGTDAFGRDSVIAIVQAPRSLPRIINMPRGPPAVRTTSCCCPRSSTSSSTTPVRGHGGLGCYQFRVTRNSDLFVDEEEVDDLLRALEGELASAPLRRCRAPRSGGRLPGRRSGRLPAPAVLADRPGLYRVPGPVNLHRLMAVFDSSSGRT